MGFGQAVSTCFSKYATFRGRARRSEFWFFTLFTWIVTAALYVLLMIATAGSAGSSQNSLGAFGIIVIILLAVFSLATIIPGISVAVRRLHDTDRSGGWWWFGLVPFVGGIVLIVFFATEGTRTANRFGPDPKGA